MSAPVSLQATKRLIPVKLQTFTSDALLLPEMCGSGLHVLFIAHEQTDDSYASPRDCKADSALVNVCQ